MARPSLSERASFTLLLVVCCLLATIASAYYDATETGYARRISKPRRYLLDDETAYESYAEDSVRPARSRQFGLEAWPWPWKVDWWSIWNPRPTLRPGPRPRPGRPPYPQPPLQPQPPPQQPPPPPEPPQPPPQPPPPPQPSQPRQFPWSLWPIPKPWPSDPINPDPMPPANPSPIPSGPDADSAPQCGKVPMYEQVHGSSFHQPGALASQGGRMYRQWFRSATDPTMTASTTSDDDGDNPDNEVKRNEEDEYSNSTEPQIWYGANAVKGEWPWIAQIQGGGIACSASIIGSRWILSAAHCGEGWVNSYSATLNMYAIGRGGRRVRIDRIVSHPGYVKGGLNNDIALFHTASPINYDQETRPVCLVDPQGSRDVVAWAKGKKCFVTGYGLVENNRRADHLKKLNVEPKYCGWKPQGAVCVGPATTRHVGATCNGDSGGPFVCYDDAKQRWEQFGVVSYGPQGCGAGYNGRWETGASNVGHFRQWVVSNTGKLS